MKMKMIWREERRGIERRRGGELNSTFLTSVVVAEKGDVN